MNTSAQTTTPSQPARRAILVDDERLARKALRTLLKDHPSVEIVGEADGVDAAWRLVQELDPDVIFLDVQMFPLDGFQLVHRMATGASGTDGATGGSGAEIVFVTAHDRYAIEAFESNALDYLTKPVVPGRLAMTIGRLEESLHPRSRQPIDLKEGIPACHDLQEPDRLLPSDNSSPSSGPSSPDEVFVLTDRGRMRMVRAREMYSIHSEGSYTHLRIQGGMNMMVRESISDWESRLPPDLFIKISRSLLINRTCISSLDQRDRNTANLLLKDFAKPIVLSRLESQRLRKALSKS
jgi:two-component system LytT family response regulator